MEKSLAGGPMKGIYITTLTRFQQIVSVILSVQAARAAGTPNTLPPRGLSMATGTWLYSIMRVRLTACTVRTIILNPKHFLLKQFRQNNSPRPWTKKHAASAISAATRRHRSCMQSRLQKLPLKMPRTIS